MRFSDDDQACRACLWVMNGINRYRLQLAKAPEPRQADVEQSRPVTAKAHWLGLRPHYSASDRAVCRYGLSAVAVGLDEGGAAWLARLARLRWFAGLDLDVNDLQAAKAGSAGGSWELADTNPALPPQAPFITLAIDDPASVNVVEATSLVRTLGRLGRVLVTMPGGDHATDLAESLRAMGAFVVR